jgi:xanthine dehydrogenase accessory factor
MNLDTARFGLSLLERGEDFAWVTILNTHGSSPRHQGASMLVRADASIAGTIGGGPLEATSIAQAVEAVRTREDRLVDFDSRELGMACGGGGRLLIEYVAATRPGVRQLFDAVLGVWERGHKAWLVTSVPRERGSWSPVRRCLVDSCDSLTDDPLCDTYVQSIGTQGAAYVFGAGHCGQSLMPVLSALNFFTVVVDDRPEFASQERFPTADRIEVAASFESVVQALPIDEDSYLVIVTRGHSHDKCVLAQALRTKAAYIGMIGSTRKVTQTFEALSQEKFSADDLARVHAPIGLSIGAETPEEIAISIAAELIQVRAAKAR